MTEPAAPRAFIPADDDDVVLARRIGEGDRGAFELMMRRYNRRLYRLARATLRDDAEAEDALQDAYLAAYGAIAQFRGDSSLSTWLSRLVLNECFGRLRRSARRQNVVPIAGSLEEMNVNDLSGDSAEGPDRLAMRSEVRALIEHRLDELPDIYRVVFVLRSVEELSVEETAECLSIPEATVRSRHFKARSMLREALARDIDAGEQDVFGFDGARCDRIVAAVLEGSTRVR